MKLTVVLEKTAANWGAYTPDEIGSVVAMGGTREETIENFRMALKSHLQAMRELGRDVPSISELEIQETVPA